MKRYITLLTLIGATASVSAQFDYTPDTKEIAKSFYQSEQWAKAFAGSYGVDPGVEPKIPEDQESREVLGQIRTLLQAQTDQSVKDALAALETFFLKNQKAGKANSPMIQQIAGTLTMRLGELSEGSEKARYVNKAENYFNAAIEAFPNFLRAHKNLANLYFRNDKSSEAKKHFVKALELGDKDSITYGLLGAIYFEEGFLVSAESALRNSLLINPKIKEFKQLLGNVLLQQERYHEAKEIFTELLAKDPNNVNFWNAQSNCYVALEMIDEASNNLEMVRLMGKANVPSLMLLGDVYMNKNMIKEATEAYTEAIAAAEGTKTLSSFISSAKTLNSYGAYEASASLVSAVQQKFEDELTEEDQIELLNLSSQLNIAMGEGEKAAENLTTLLKKDPFNAGALLTLANYYANLKPSEELDEIESKRVLRENQNRAFIYFERAQSLEDDPKTRVKAYIGQAMLHIKREGELDDAAEALEEAQAIEFQDNVQSYLTQIRAALQAQR